MQRALLVLAAGAGSRYGGLKQIDPVGPAGETLLDYSVHDAIQAGFEQLVFVIRQSFEGEFRRVVGSRYEGLLPVQYAFQEMDDLPAGYAPPAGRAKPWGTGHAVLAARSVLTGPFAVINADDFYGAEAMRLLAEFLRGQCDPACHTLVAYELARTLSEHGTVSRGLCRAGKDGLLQEVREVTGIERDDKGARAPVPSAEGWEKFTGQELVSMNCWGFMPGFLPHLERLFGDFLAAHAMDLTGEFYLPAAVDRLIRENEARVTVQRTAGSWFGMTHREDKERVRQSIAQLVHGGVYPDPLR